MPTKSLFTIVCCLEKTGHEASCGEKSWLFDLYYEGYSQLLCTRINIATFGNVYHLQKYIYFSKNTWFATDDILISLPLYPQFSCFRLFGTYNEHFIWNYVFSAEYWITIYSRIERYILHISSVITFPLNHTFVREGRRGKNKSNSFKNLPWTYK